MASPALRPFPWRSLLRLPRAAAEASSRARAALRPHLDPTRLAAEASALLRQPVEVTQVAVGLEPPAGPSSRVCLEWLTPPLRLWIDAEPALVLRVAEALLGLSGGWVDPRCAPPPEAEGAWAAFLVALGRRAGVEAPPRLGPPPVPGEAVVVRVALRLGGELFSVRIGLPLGDLPATPTRFDRPTLASLGALPLSLSLVAAQSLATHADLAELVPGAAWAPGDAWTLRPLPGHLAQGHGLLVTGASELAAEVSLTTLGSALALVLTRPLTPAPWEPPMTDPSEAPPEADLAAALAESPVVLRVEVASVTLEAQKWALLGPGDVVATGVRLGEPVTLRANGVAVARGELCDLDGELAVRILHRL